MTEHPSDEGNMGVAEALEAAMRIHREGRLVEASALYRQILAADPGNADVFHMLGVMAHQLGSDNDAVALIGRAIALKGTVADFYMDLGLALWPLGRLEETLAAYDSALRLKPDYAEAHANRGDVLTALGRLDDALAACDTAVRLNPDCVSAHNNRGNALSALGRSDAALAAYDTVLSFQPDLVLAHSNRGNALSALGRLDAALTAYDAALRLDPDNAETHSNLASLMMMRGDLARAADLARRAIELNPQLADAYLTLADIEAARDRPGESLRWLDSLLAFAPDHPGALGARAVALTDLDRLDEAEACARRAVAAAPHSAEAHNALGQVLHARDRFDETLAEYDLATRLPGTAATVAGINRAHLLMEAGRKAEALAEFDRAVDRFPLVGVAWLGRSDTKTFTAGDPDIARMEALLEPGGMQAPEDRINLHFAIAKACLDAGDGDRAFHHLGEGNRMKRSRLPHEPQAAIDGMRGVARTFSADLLRDMADAGCPSARPIFVAGMPRSGTTLIERILAAHPNIHGAGELPAIINLSEAIPSYPAGIARLTKTNLADLGRRYCDRIESLGQGRHHVVDKMPGNFLHLGLIRLILPKARIIHVRRDPVDTCLSCYTKLFANGQYFSYDLAELGRYHRAYQDLMAHWRQVLPADRFLEVDYEAVVADLEGQARRMLAFLGLPWNQSCVRFHENKGSVRTASVNQVRQPIHAKSVGRWRPYARHLGPLLDALGIDGAD